MKTVLKMLAICMMAGGLGVQSVYAEPLVIQEQGSFSAGGTIITAPGTFDAKKPLDSAGQTYHGDHASVFYQIPENPHKYPIVMLHGAGQSSRTWESTPDGREGFQNIFLRRGFSTYIVDQPRRGDAGRTTVEGTVTPKPDEQMWFNQFRVGVWPDYFKGVQFSHDKEALNQYFRQMTPNTGPFDVNVISDAMMTTIGVTERLSSWNQRTEVHDWKRRSERLVRACGHIYTIVRPGWFDYNNDDEHRIVMLQGDRRHAGTPEDGVISREQIAQVLVTALSNDAAKNKTFELVAERGEAQQDLTLLFAELRNDNPQKNDGVFDIDNMPLTEEPECVINDLNLYSKNSKI
ncbi:TPA: NAD(P)H-binding protein [Escherichia coli]|nr:NAD(P)H-binding protein [Escherichia coli]